MHEINAAIADALVDAARELSARVERLDFAAPVSHRYNPLNYAWAPHELYLRRYGANRKKVAVSYTHLDVYKRQSWVWATPCMSMPIG